MASLRNGLLVSLLIIAPWAFASIHEPTQIALKLLATALAGALFLRKRPTPSRRDIVLAALTLFILLYGLVSLFNTSLAFLPASIDPKKSSLTLWGCLGLAAIFWSVRAWVSDDPSARRKLIWLMLINGALIALVSIAQRVTMPYKVLWIYQPDIVTYYYVFGPFEYRATAAQFFNLLWPVALGLYVQDKSSRNPGRHFPLLLVALLMAAPLITSSRGGLLMSGLALALFLGGLFMSGKISQPIRVRLLLIALGVVILFAFFGVRPLQRRLSESASIADFLSLHGRVGQNQNSWRMVTDHPLWGVGPGAYETAFRAYKFPNAFQPPRHDPQEQPAWDFFYAKAHNDWLQTVVEWGLPATFLIALGILMAWSELLARPQAEPILAFSIATSLLTLLLHAAFDYPLQNLAILIYFATLLGLAKRAPAPGALANEHALSVGSAPRGG